nr:pleiotropic drug resistance protein 1-like [Ipomoea batatas]
MEGGDMFRGGSARLGSSNVWRNSAMEVFSSRGEGDNDEEALKWAAIEKLPTYLRVRRGILTEEEGQCKEVDVKGLGLVEKKNLLERLVRVAEEDNEKFLLKLKQRIDRVDIDLPTIEVRFEHLNVDAEAYVGSRALPTIFNFTVNMLETVPPNLTYLGSDTKERSKRAVLTSRESSKCRDNRDEYGKIAEKRPTRKRNLVQRDQLVGQPLKKPSEEY